MSKTICIDGREFELVRINSNDTWPAFFGDHIKETDPEFIGYVLRPLILEKSVDTIEIEGQEFTVTEIKKALGKK